ncbi:MAG: hypothetical protein HY290_11290 [Planctomycetia bacterium]|nr:hypothetical protein [Planctomycetia bacterium]
MKPSNRREFLSDVSRGMLVAGLGASLANDLGFSTAFAEQGSNALVLGEYASLVGLLESTPADKLQPILAEKLRRGETNMRQLIGAAALANAETFGGCDYVGFHTAMAMLPSLEMAKLLPADRQPLPVFKVLYRNSQQIQSVGGASKKTLQALHEAEHASDGDLGVSIRDACREQDIKKAEGLLATTGDSAVAALNAVMPAIVDDINVHRFVFAYRTYGLAGLLGKGFAQTCLRQCVHFCADHERMRVEHKHAPSAIRTVLPKLLDQYKLAGATPGKRDPGDAAIEALCNAIYSGPPERSAEAVAAAIAEGISLEAVGESISLASNLLALRQGPDKWRTHGDSAGVHSSDATNAWRNMARVTDSRHAIAGLIVAAYHSAIHTPFTTPAYPTDEHRAEIKAIDAAGLLAVAEDAVRHNDQGRAAAAIAIYGERGNSPEAAYNMLLKFAVSEDGRLHGEKYFHTVREEFGAIRPAFRWRQLVALGRVTASAYGYNREDKHGFRAAGYEEACKLLGVEA